MELPVDYKRFLMEVGDGSRDDGVLKRESSMRSARNLLKNNYLTSSCFSLF